VLAIGPRCWPSAHGAGHRPTVLAIGPWCWPSAPGAGASTQTTAEKMPGPTYARIFSRPEKTRAQDHSEKSQPTIDLDPNLNTPGVERASR